MESAKLKYMKKLIITLACAISLISCTKTTYYRYPCVIWVKGDTLAVSYVRNYLLSDTMLYNDKGIHNGNLEFNFLYGSVELPIMQCNGKTEFESFTGENIIIDSVK